MLLGSPREQSLPTAMTQRYRSVGGYSPWPQRTDRILTAPESEGGRGSEGEFRERTGT